MTKIPSAAVRLIAALGVLALASCATINGVGQDVQQAGRGISKGANKVQNKITN